MSTRMIVALAFSALLVCLVCGGVWSYDNCSRYGVVDQWGYETPELGQGSADIILQNLGTKYIRSGWDWDLIEGPGDNQYDQNYLALMDNWVTGMNALGVHILYGFSYTPAWARPGGTGNNTPPTDPTRYTDFITFMVNRYKDSIKDWGFWNETNIDGFWNGTDDNYIHNLLIPGIAAVKAADPTAKCVVGELASCCNEQALLQTTLNEINAHGEKNLVDVVCVHAYGYGDTASGRLAHLDDLHNMIVSIGWGGKDFWCTETSWGGNETNQSNQVMAFMQGMDARRSWFKKTFYFTLGEGVLDSQGLIRPDQSLKPAYTNLQSYIAAHSADQWPYGSSGSVWAIPGTIQGEDYDDGCEGVSYHDNDSINSGAAYRTEGVDVETCSEGGYNVGWMGTGEWLEWTVNVAGAGTYNMNVRVASPNSGRTFHIEMNGNNVTGTKTVTNTGSWQTWATVTAAATLNAGQQIMRLVVDSGDWNLNYLNIAASGQDTTAPTFGGSINPSTTTTFTPTITITAQDTGVGLNVGSSEFAYSVDGGASFTTYVGRFVLHSKGTGAGGGNKYWYPDFYHPSYTIVSGDHLQYDIYGNNSDGSGAVDLEGSFGNLRDSGITDQNGLSGHANTNLYSRDYHQWYHRDFDLSSKAGQSIAAYEMAHETDSGVSEFYVRNVIITNNGQVKDRAANSDAWTAVSDTIAPGNSGYSSTVGPEMIAGDPASPASCTGSNGTTAQQTVSAVFSNGMMPLVAGGNNRIKYHISDMNANRAVSSTFALTVNATSTLNGKAAGTITIDGNTSDWSLSQFTTYTRGGQNQTGDIALVGYDGGVCYYGGYVGVLPTSAADHTAKVYCREDSSYVYFLARCDDNDIQYPYAVGTNWANDCVEFFIDPSHDHGSSSINNSVSDIQLDVDANNQRNVYMCTSGYTTQVLNGVTSAVVRDGTGWWLEMRITKTVLDPDLPGSGPIGIDFNFRDNDNNNDAALTTVYDWRDWGAGFPSKIPDHWGDCVLP